MSTKPPSGTRDFLPDDVRRREYVVRTVREVYESYGFEPLETPAFENIETLLGKYGEEGNKLIFKILRRGEHEGSGEADLALRYDLTVPLARVVAQYQSELPRFFKRYQIQPVWRADRPARGRFREFYQCDIDAIGSTSPVVEAELMAAVSEVLGRLGFADFTIRLNDRRVLDAIFGSLPREQRPGALIAIDKWDKIGPHGVRQELLQRGVTPVQASVLVAFFGDVQDAEMQPGGATASLAEDNAAWLDRLKAQFPASADAVASLTEILSLAQATAAGGTVRIDPSLARGLSYYTGAIMEIAVADLPGSLGGGGRYDNLIGMFLGRDIPACGFSLGFERILVVMEERGMFPSEIATSASNVVVVCHFELARMEALRFAGELRSVGLHAEVFPDSGKSLEKPLKYAKSRSIPLMAILGENELATHSVTVKQLETREAFVSPRELAAKAIKERVSLGLARP